MQGPPAANTTIVNYDSVGAASAPNLTCAPYDRHNSHRQWGEARADSEAPSQWRARDAARCSGSLPLIWHAWLSHLVAEPNTAWQCLRCVTDCAQRKKMGNAPCPRRAQSKALAWTTHSLSRCTPGPSASCFTIVASDPPTHAKQARNT